MLGSFISWFTPSAAAESGSDFIATFRTISVPSEGGVACAQFSILTDFVALEMDEEFEVSFTLVGPGDIDTEGRLLIDNGRDRAIPGLRVAHVRIQDQNGKIMIID